MALVGDGTRGKAWLKLPPEVTPVPDPPSSAMLPETPATPLARPSGEARGLPRCPGTSGIGSWG